VVAAEGPAAVAEAVVVARSVAAVPAEVAVPAEAVEPVVAATPAAVVVAAAAAVAPVGRTTRPHRCAEASTAAGSDISRNLTRELSGWTYQLNNLSRHHQDLCIRGSPRSAPRCKVSFKGRAETPASGIVSNG
jgi:hypothetical protein